MLDIEKLKTAELPEIMECIDEIYIAHKVLSDKLELFKTYVKDTGEQVTSPLYSIGVSISNTLEAEDLNVILQKYPLEKFPNMYTIKLNKNAGDIIKEVELLEEKQVKSIRFKPHGQD